MCYTVLHLTTSDYICTCIYTCILLHLTTSENTHSSLLTIEVERAGVIVVLDVLASDEPLDAKVLSPPVALDLHYERVQEVNGLWRRALVVTARHVLGHLVRVRVGVGVRVRVS